MRARLKGAPAALAVATLMVGPPAAGAQDPVPTISPTPSPTATVSPTPAPTTTPTPDEVQDAKTRKRKVVRRIYRDFEKDGRIAACDHTPKALKLTLDSISDEYNTDYPDFKDALKAAIRANKRQQCDVEETPTPTPTSTATPAPTNTAPSTPTTPSTPPSSSTPFPTPSSTPESGSIPGLGGTFDNGSGNGKTPKAGKGPSPTATPGPGEGAIPEGTPQPTPSPTPSSGPLPPKLVVTRASAEPNLFVPGTMLGISLLGLLFAALSALAARRSGRLAGVGHAWREAAFRASGAWAEFKDWLRLGR
jgi:hypothetical protein